jgi:hypothetical protein
MGSAFRDSAVDGARSLGMFFDDTKARMEFAEKLDPGWPGHGGN